MELGDLVVSFQAAVLGDARGPRLTQLTWSVYTGEFWIVTGGPASGKSSLVAFFAGRLSVLDGSAKCNIGRLLCASWEEQVQLRIGERRRFTGDDLDPEDPGTTAWEWYVNQGGKVGFWESFQLASLEDTGLRFLSTGETRKIWLALAFSLAEDVLVLDCPLDGLDRESRVLFQEILADWKTTKRTVVLTLRPMQTIDLPVTGVFWLAGRRSDSLEVQKDGQIKRSGAPLIEWRNGNLRQGHRVLVQGLEWTVRPGEAWQLRGPNGCGKSTLISVLLGEDAQAFTNDLRLFGKRRGQDLDLEEIRRRTRVVSMRQLESFDERFWGLTAEVILSGWTNTMGLDTHRPPAREEASRLAQEFGLADLWDRPFHLLSPAQRVAGLAARACLVQPDLLILDEPDQHLSLGAWEVLLRYAERYLNLGTAVLLVTHDPRHVPAWVRFFLEWVGNHVIVNTTGRTQ